VIPPYGLQSGQPGAPFKVTIAEKSGRTFELPGKANIRLGSGDRVIVDSCGGGGYGAPEDAG
jgi:N-methylhydantoinase B